MTRRRSESSLFAFLPHASALAAVFWVVVVVFLPGLTQCSETCFNFDENGNRIEFECETCVENDANDCTVNSWQLPSGSTCDLSQQPLEDDGTLCDAGGSAGTCMSGVCEAAAVLAAGSGSTTWRATTTPPGGGQFLTGGCELVLPVILDQFNFDTTITMNVTSDGLGNVTIGYDLVLSFPLWVLFANSASFGDASIATAITDATPGTVTNSAEASATGQLVSTYLVGNDLVLSTSGGQLTEETVVVLPTTATSANINFSGQFSLDIDLGPDPLFAITEADCTFDVQGAGVDFAVVQP